MPTAKERVRTLKQAALHAGLARALDAKADLGLAESLSESAIPTKHERRFPSLIGSQRKGIAETPKTRTPPERIRGKGRGLGSPHVRVWRDCWRAPLGKHMGAPEVPHGMSGTKQPIGH